MIFLVTGGAGFIGSHLCEMLLNQGEEVRLVDDFSTGRKENLKTFIHHKNLILHQIDIRDRSKLAPCFENVDKVMHLAGLADIVPSIEHPSLYYSVNATGTLNVLECARKAGVKKIVYAASSSCYGIPELYPTPESSPIRPMYPYALTKYIGEELLQHWHQTYHIPYTSLRLFNVYGPRSRTTGAYGAVFGVFLAQKIHQKPFTVVGDGRQTRDFVFVTDIARAFITAANSEKTGCFNVGGGGHQSINRLVELLGGDVVHIPKRPGEPDCTFADITAIQKSLSWQPEVSFETGVEKMLSVIEDWRDAPVWNPESVAKATESWFRYLGEDQ
ncbi:SDR family oxidoreductase [Magnetococcales bacterium HHB-1]